MKRPIRYQVGVSLLEFSISASLFFMLLLGAVLWGLNIWEMNTLQYAVERGARCAILPVSPTGQKLCGVTTEFAAKNALGLSSDDGKTGTVTSANFMVQTGTPNLAGTGSEQYSFSPGASATSATFNASCVTTKDINLFSAAMPLISAGGVAGTVRFCRVNQD